MCVFSCWLSVFCFKQKTAYEMRISDWSSDVCSSDLYDPSLLFPIARRENRATLPFPPRWTGADIWNAYEVSWLNLKGKPLVGTAQFIFPESIGKASCRERVCPYV